MKRTKSDQDWAVGYALQALSDLQVCEILANSKAHKCHRLHFLQMAAEKVCKAHLINASGYDSVKKSHAYVAKVLPIIARRFYSIASGKNGNPRGAIDKIRTLAREIELLCPACDADKSREDNCEYPWQDAKQNIHIPCMYNFPEIDDTSRDIVHLIKLLRVAAESYGSSKS